jgi:chromosome segregation ATPase
MTDALLFAILWVGVATLTVAVFTWRSSRRSEALGEDRYELLRDQRDRLGFLDKERRMLIEELKRESEARQRFVEDMHPQVAKDVEQERRQLEEQLGQERQARAQSVRSMEEQEQEWQRLEQERRRLEEQLGWEQDERARSQQASEQVAQQLEQLRGDLKREQEEHSEIQRRAEQLEQERQRLEWELKQSKEEVGSVGRAPAPNRAGQAGDESPRWRRPVLIVGLLLGALAMWLTSLVVAINLLSL